MNKKKGKKNTFFHYISNKGTGISLNPLGFAKRPLGGVV